MNSLYNEIQKDKAYSFLFENENLKNKLSLLVLGGSRAYGTNLPTSDVDIRGIANNTKEEVLLGKDFEQVVERETDTTIYSTTKIIRLLMEANPNTLEILFVRPEDVLYENEIGRYLRDNRHLFLSQRVFYTFGGYARQQLRRLDNKSMRSLSQGQQEIHILNSIKNASVSFPERYFYFPEDAIQLYVDDAINSGMEKEIFMDVNLHHYPLRDYKCMWVEMQNIIKEYGKIGKRASHAILHDKVNKHAMHLVRLMQCCIKILEEGDFCTYCKENHDFLMDIRQGKYMDENNQMKPEFFEIIDELENQMNKAKEKSVIPENIDYKAIEKLKLHINEEIVMNNI